jgi:gluconolactonase
MMIMRLCQALLFVSLAVSAADSPLVPGEKPVREASAGAGEGPAWDAKGHLYFTGGGRITRRDGPGKYQTVREAPGANGLLFDHQDRLIACENRRVTRTEADGAITVLADTLGGKRFNSPNDLAIDSKGRIYFSDPRYGRRDGMERTEGVYRIDAPGNVTQILGEGSVDRPNGLLVSPDDRYLYVADNNNNTDGGVRKLWRFDLRPDGAVDARSRKLIFDWKTSRGPDGLDVDQEGRLYVAAGRNKPTPYETPEPYKGGVYIISPDGKLIEVIPIPDDEVTNVAFGGSDRKTLFITAGGNLWSIRVNTPGWSR